MAISVKAASQVSANAGQSSVEILVVKILHLPLGWGRAPNG